MVIRKTFRKNITRIVFTGCVAIGLSVSVSSVATAATIIQGPIDLGAAATFGTLGGSTVTNTGPSVVDRDVGVSPGTSITGFEGPPAGLANGTIHSADAVASQAQTDLTGAINDAASLTPTTSGLANLSGLSLTPGVYSGGELSLNSGGLLTLAGTADSVWVFQAASTLTIGSGAQIQLTGGASSCNVFWQVGSSATIGTNADFVGTVMASTAITANTGAEIQGRLLASTAAVTLDTNRIIPPTGCAPASTPVETASPAFTSETPPDAVVDEEYDYTVTALGTPAPTYTVSSGTLPAGLSLNATSGLISGTPTTPGTSTLTLTASNGVEPAVSQVVTIETAPAPLVTEPTEPTTPAVPAGPATPTTPAPGTDTPARDAGEGQAPVSETTPLVSLPSTGTDAPVALGVAAALLLMGAALLITRRIRAARSSS